MNQSQNFVIVTTLLCTHSLQTESAEQLMKHGMCGSNDKSCALTAARLTAHEGRWSPQQHLRGHGRHR